MPSFTKSGNALVIALITASTFAMPFAANLDTITVRALTIDVAEFPYQAPGPDDSRGPCPALNALANHGILPRNGRDINLQMARDAALYLGMGATPSDTVMNGALLTSTTGDPETLNLGDFAQHDPQQVEYDASISRTDAYFGNPGPFNQTVWDRSQSSWATDSDLITFKDAKAELAARTAYAEENNPTYQKLLGQVGARLNYANLWYAFGSHTDGNANRAWVKMLFEEERLPLELGWTPPTEISTVLGLSSLIGKMDLGL